MGWGLKRREAGADTTGTAAATRTAAAAAVPQADPLQPPGRETSWNAKVFEHIEWRRYATTHPAPCESGSKFRLKSIPCSITGWPLNA